MFSRKIVVKTLVKKNNSIKNNNYRKTVNIDYHKLAITGLKILAAVVGGAVVYAGLRGNNNDNKEQAEQPQVQQPKIKTDEVVVNRNRPLQEQVLTTNTPYVKFEDHSDNEVGKKILSGLKKGQVLCDSAIGIISSLVSASNSLNSIFGRGSMLTDQQAYTGYYGFQMVPGVVYYLDKSGHRIPGTGAREDIVEFYAKMGYPLREGSSDFTPDGIPYDVPQYRYSPEDGKGAFVVYRRNGMINMYSEYS